MPTMESNIEDFIEKSLEEIDEQITKIDNSKVMKAAEKLIEKKTILMATRRALLGGNKMTGGSGSRIVQSDVVKWFTDNDERDGAIPADIAEELHTTEAVIRGHLNRGKDERFLKKDNRWYLRDPEAGVNTVDDIDGGDED
jgi:hypothetical protein